MAKLYFRYGCMNSGKSLDMLKVIFNYEELGRKVLVITSSLDNRYGIDKIKSRTGIEKEAISISEETNITEVFLEKQKDGEIHCVLCDEVQFYKKHHIKELTEIVDRYNTPVICYGLRSDFRLEPFEGSMYLMAVADKIEEIKTICTCGKKAVVNCRIVDGKLTIKGEQIVIGDTNYISLCRKCFKQRLKNDF